jgi:ankyrin repeat protein
MMRQMLKAAAAAFLLTVTGVVLSAVMLAESAQAQPNPERDRAFFDAAERGEIKVVRELFAQGAQINWRDHRGRTPLLAAIQRNRIDVARFLIQEGADVNAKDLGQDTPFLVAGAEGRTEIMRAILTAGPNLKDTNRFGGTALIPAAHRGHVETVKLLLTTKIDKNHVNNLGWTALMEAVVLGDGGPAHTEIVRLLVAAGANVNIPDRDRITPLEHAKRRGYTEMVKILSAASR